MCMRVRACARVCAVWCMVCAVCCVLCGVCCVLCAVCCVVCAVCRVLCAVCCVLCAVWYIEYGYSMPVGRLPTPPGTVQAQMLNAAP